MKKKKKKKNQQQQSHQPWGHAGQQPPHPQGYPQGMPSQVWAQQGGWAQPPGAPTPNVTMMPTPQGPPPGTSVTIMQHPGQQQYPAQQAIQNADGTVTVPPRPNDPLSTTVTHIPNPNLPNPYGHGQPPAQGPAVAAQAPAPGASSIVTTLMGGGPSRTKGKKPKTTLKKLKRRMKALEAENQTLRKENDKLKEANDNLLSALSPEAGKDQPAADAMSRSSPATVSSKDQPPSEAAGKDQPPSEAASKDQPPSEAASKESPETAGG